MSYFTELSELNRDYDLSLSSRTKVVLLYPIFKLHYWYYYAVGARRTLARSLFKIIPKRASISLPLNGGGRHARVPLWLVPDRLTSFREIFWKHSYCLERGWMPDLLIDAGANAGYASLYFALMYPIKKALLIEANSELYSDIAPIIAEMNTLGVKVYLAKGALVGKTREVKIEIPENSRDSKISDTSAGNASGTKVLTIPGKRLSEWLADAGFAIDSKNALLKMDIEGAEYELIKDDPTLFKQFRYLIAEVHGVAQKRDTFAEAIKPSHKVLERQTTPACDEVEVLVAQASV